MRLWGFEYDALSDLVTAPVLVRRTNEGELGWLSAARQLLGHIGTDRERYIGGEDGRCPSFSATGGDRGMINVGIARR